MTAERLLLELASDDVPKISLGKFNWRPVDQGQASQTKTDPKPTPASPQPPTPAAAIPLAFRQSLGAPILTAEAFPLNLLENKTFMGTGMNMIWRPKSKPSPSKLVKEDLPDMDGTASDVLQFNMTAESMAFSGSIGEDIPNRGANDPNVNFPSGGGPEDQPDIFLQGIPYVQRVGSFEDPTAFNVDEVISSKAKRPNGIHFETGCFMFVPANRTTKEATLNRMASIPHGTTINAQGPVPPTTPRSGKPAKADKVFLDRKPKPKIPKVAATERAKAAPNGGIPAISIVPFNISPDPKKPGEEVDFFDDSHLTLDSTKNRLPRLWKDFVGKQIITEKMFRDPNEVLSKAIEDQEIESFFTFTLSTAASDNLRGGGVANIGFLEGLPANRDRGRGNAQPVSMTVTYWIEKVKATLTIKPQVSSQQAFQMINKAGVLGPLFIAPPTMNRSNPTSVDVNWTQLQYSQNVTLNFNGLSWPHISVATLGETGNKDLILPPP